MISTGLGKHIPPVELIANPHDRELCPVSMAEYYLQRTKEIRGVFIKLFISYVYPNLPVTTSTLARWCREILKQAGISETYSAHSAGSAATSKLKHQLLEFLCQKFAKLLDGLPQILREVL